LNRFKRSLQLFVFLNLPLLKMLIWIIIISMMLIGLALVILELIFIPGTTVVGLLGLVFSIIGIVVTYNHFGGNAALYLLLAMLAVSLATLVFSFRTAAWGKFSLKSSIDSRVNEGLLQAVSIGDEGVTLSSLRPIGKAEFNHKTYEVKTSGGYVNTGEKVKIIRIESHQIVVEPLRQL